MINRLNSANINNVSSRRAVDNGGPVSRGDAKISDSFTTAPAEEKEWTILAYMDGANDLKESFSRNLKEMESVGSNKDMNIAAYVARDNPKLSLSNLPDRFMSLFKKSNKAFSKDWTGSRVYHVQKGDPESKEISSTLIQDRGREKTNDAGTLESFIEMGVKRFPAKKYMLIISSHGAGHRGAVVGRDGKPVPAAGIRSAIKNAEKKSGKKVDVLAMEACNMGQVEFAEEMKDAADFLVASPGRMYDESIDYKSFLGQVDHFQEQGYKIEPDEMAGILVESTEDFYRDVPGLTALNLSGMPDIKAGMQELIKHTTSGKTPRETIKNLIKSSPQHSFSVYSKKHHNDGNFIDLVGFCNRVVESDGVEDPGLKKAAVKLKETIDKNTVHKKVHYFEHEDQGLSVYAPVLLGEAGRDAEYNITLFTRD